MLPKIYYDTLQSIVWQSLIIDKEDYRHPLYNTWRNMLARCYQFKNPSFVNYGYRNIEVSIEWRVFKQFAADMGEKPGKEYSIHRVNPEGNYCKENCVWADSQRQAREKRSRRQFCHDDPWRDSRTLTTKQKAENLERIKVLKEARKRERLVDPGYVGVLE